jgi:hypothetical protein
VELIFYNEKNTSSETKGTTQYTLGNNGKHHWEQEHTKETIKEGE